MTYSASTPVRLLPGEAQDISEKVWVDVYTAAGSFASPLWNGVPAEDRVNVCRAMYQFVTQRRHRASFWLAIPGREHGWGTNADSVLWRMDTRSATNARSCRTPGMHTSQVTDPVRKSAYTRYDVVQDSLTDGLNRIDDPAYAYAGKVSIAEIIGIWDEGDAQPYIDYVVNMMNVWTNRTVTVPQGDDPRYAWKPDLTEFGYPTAGTHGRNGYDIELGILHITLGTNSESQLVDQHGSSVQYLTNADGTPRDQILAEADAAWGCGNEEFNCRAIQWEIEKPLLDSQWSDALVREVAKSVAPRAVARNLPAVYVGKNAPKGTRGWLGHSDVPDPNTPGLWGGSTHHTDPGANFPWPLFITYLQQEVDAVNGTPAQPDAPVTEPAIHFADCAFVYKRGFMGRFLAVGAGVNPADPIIGGLTVYGKPLEDEWEGADGGSFQRTERYLLQWQPGIAEPWDIVGVFRDAEPPDPKPQP